MPLLGFWGYFLQIMILLLFAGSGRGRRAEDEHCIPQDTPLSIPDLRSAPNPRKTEIPHPQTSPSTPSCWELEKREPKRAWLQKPQSLFLLSQTPPFPEILCSPRCSHVFSC